MLGSVQAAELYYTNRVVNSVTFNLPPDPPEELVISESARLTETVHGDPIVLNSNQTYAIEREAFTVGYLSAIPAWNAAVAYQGPEYEYADKGKIFDNVGWVRGTWLARGEWGAYLWTVQNRIVFKSSATNWWKASSGGVLVEIGKVIVGSMEDIYGPTQAVVDVGPHLTDATNNFPGENQAEAKEFYVDTTNVYYQVLIPAIWLRPKQAFACVGGSNVPFIVTGTNIPRGVDWLIYPTNFAGHADFAVTTTNSAWVTPGIVATNYKIRATSKDNTNFYDEVDLTVIKIEKIPLGRTANLDKYIIGKVYIPTKWGGSNSLSGANIQLFYTDGTNLDAKTAIQIAKGELDGNRVAQGNPCVYEVPSGKFGWYYVKIIDESEQTISSTFYEHGEVPRPWQGYYWSIHPDINPNLYDDGYALDKYDQVYGTTSQVWEASNHVSAVSWHGHCWGTAVASVLTNQPAAALSTNDVDFSQEDMEGLYIELADCIASNYLAYSVTNIPASPVSAETGEAIDSYCDDFHNVLATVILYQHKPLVGNLRHLPGTDVSQVWNHAVYKYRSEMRQTPEQDNEKAVRTYTMIQSPETAIFPSDGPQDRLDYYIYDVKYDTSGAIDGNYTNQNWISASGYPPKFLCRLKISQWTAQNPEVTLEKVRNLYGN